MVVIQSFSATVWWGEPNLPTALFNFDGIPAQNSASVHGGAWTFDARNRGMKCTSPIREFGGA